MNAEILTVGAELLAGDILDTNCRDIARALGGLGVSVSRHVTVPDDPAAIAEAVTGAVERADVVLVTGGLGPTPDDRTREGVARGLGLGLRLREDLREALEARYRSYGNRSMPEVNLVQITLPEGAEALPNPLGTAPGFRLEHGTAVLFTVPGIPREMHRMLADSILPWLAVNRPVAALASRVLKTIGIGESELVSRFGPVFAGLSGVAVGFYPQMPGVHIKLTARGRGTEDAEAALEDAGRAIRAALGTRVFGGDADTLPGVVGACLLARGWTLATAESYTGGALAAAVTSEPGASRYFDRCIVAYANRAKTDLLGVPEDLLAAHGAVSESVARAMAEGLRARSGADVTVATTGVAGPAGGTPEKPVGLAFTAIAAPGGTRAWRSTHPGSRDMVVARGVATDLNRLRLVLLGER
jgi:nicotinamide-nucleotide amidase